MRISFDWLGDYVDLSNTSVQEVADALTMGAFEVEEVKLVGPQVEGPLVVGEIVEINPHPNADRIRLTRVKVSPEEEPLDIVCGADNIIVGQRIPVALPGARVINRHDGTELAIKKSKIRGASSCGMLCSPPELGITAADSEGILILNGTPDLGLDVKEMLRLYPDHVLYVEPRSNRGDALCVKGMAREVGALLNLPLREPEWKLPQEDQTSQNVDVQIENPADCPYLSIRILEGLSVRPSSLHIARRLEAIGVRPVNNLVDITNYVLHELGQPLHAYDLGKINGPVIQARRAKNGEKLETLDGKTRKLNDEVLVIADLELPVGIAGVMGGKASEVTEATSFVALESAAFDPATVRRSSRLMGLSSDSSTRFERGVDLASVRYASDRAAYLMLESCKGFLGRLTQAGDDRVKPVSVSLRLDQLSRILEINPSADEVVKMLKPLGFEQTDGSSDRTVEFSVPSFRQADVTREIDLVEEVCRLWGYDRVPESMPQTTAAPPPPDRREQIARDTLASYGMSEAWISSLTANNDLTGDKGSVVRVLNPLSEDHQRLRQSLLPGLMTAAEYNKDHGRKDVWLFEVGRTYHKNEGTSDRDTGVMEDLMVAGLLTGNQASVTWVADSSAPGQQANFFVAKGAVEVLVRRFGLSDNEVTYENIDDRPLIFHPGRSCRVSLKDGTALGWLGEVHPQTTDDLGFREPVFLFELNLDRLAEMGRTPRFAEIYQTPTIIRDLTVDIDSSVEHKEVVRCIRSAGGDNLQKLELVSIFELADKNKSMSYRLTFQHSTDTLTNEAVDKQLNTIRKHLSEKLSASFRQ